MNANRAHREKKKKKQERWTDQALFFFFFLPQHVFSRIANSCLYCRVEVLDLLSLMATCTVIFSREVNTDS